MVAVLRWRSGLLCGARPRRAAAELAVLRRLRQSSPTPGLWRGATRRGLRASTPPTAPRQPPTQPLSPRSWLATSRGWGMPYLVRVGALLAGADGFIW